MSLKTTVKRALHSSGVASTLARRDGASFILAAHIVQEEEAERLPRVHIQWDAHDLVWTLARIGRD